MASLFAYGPPALFNIGANPSRHVGVKDLFLATTKAPVRVYYPATKPQNPEPVRIFRDVTNFTKGYMWSFTKNRPLLYGVLSSFTSIMRFAIPMRYIEIPNASRNPNPEGDNLPLMIFSHGLTGTGEENTMLLASIASHGFVVVSIHHTDGSSCVVTDGNGQEIWYNHPDPDNYTIGFRESQLNHRVKEMMEAKKMILSLFGNRIDNTKVVSSGYSYGGATAALTTVRHPRDFVACLVIDGWFLIKAHGVNSEFPLDVIKAKTPPVPTFFLSSSAFVNWGNGEIAERMADLNSNHRYEVYGSSSSHMLFVDLKSWFPEFMWSQVKKLKMQGEDSEALTERYVKDVIKWLMMITKTN